MAKLKMKSTTLVDDTQMIDDQRLIDDSYTIDENTTVTDFFTFLFGITFVEGYVSETYRLSPIINLSSIGASRSSEITFVTNEPAGTEIIIESNLSADGGRTWEGWKVCTSGTEIPDITSGTVLANGRLQLRQTFKTSDYTTTAELISINISIDSTLTFYNIATFILEDSGVDSDNYFVDPELINFSVPYPYFSASNHRDALRILTEAVLGQCYCDRDGLIRLEGYSYLQSKTEPDIVITRDDYFKKDNPQNYMQIANCIEVETQPLRPAPTEEVYRSNEPVNISAGQTISITAYYNSEPCIEAAASIEGAGTITDVTYYSWGADVKITSSTAGEFELVINAKPLKVQGAEKVVAKDEDSIRENGLIKYLFPKNPLVQTRQQAQQIADNLLAYFKDPRRDLTAEWRGNPAVLLGDRTRIIDEYEGEDFFVTKQNIEYDGGLKVSMEGRKADGVE